MTTPNANLNLRGVETVIQFPDDTFMYIYHFFIDLNPHSDNIIIVKPIGPLTFNATYDPSDANSATGISANFTPPNTGTGGENKIGLTAYGENVRTYYVGSCALKKGAALTADAQVSIQQYPQPQSSEGPTATTTVYGDPNSRRPPIIKLNSSSNLPADLSQATTAIGFQTYITDTPSSGNPTTHSQPDYFVSFILQATTGQTTLYPSFQLSSDGQQVVVSTMNSTPDPELAGHGIAVGLFDCNQITSPTAPITTVKGNKNDNEWHNLPTTFTFNGGTSVDIWWAQF